MRNDIAIQSTGKYGKGLFALRNFARGETVFRLAGPITDVPSIYTIPVDFGKYLDDKTLGMYLCHSCEPNCGINNRIDIVAMNEIKTSDEITIDYAMIVPEYGAEISENELVCKCGSVNCRSRLGSFNRLPFSLKQKYAGFISDYLIK